MPEEMTREQELKAMQDPDKWPHWPYLPMKRGNIWTPGNLGVLVAGQGPVIYRGNLFLFDPKTCEKTTYDSFEALYDAGWRGD